MKQLLIINVDSFVDLITNSSSELFICAGNQTIQVIEDVLIELAKEYNKLSKDKWDKNVPEDKEMFFKYIISRPTTAKFDEIDGYFDYEIKKGDIIIYSHGDNSIPWRLMEMIENKLNATQVHLG
jgi:hypothetical protein